MSNLMILLFKYNHATITTIKIQRRGPSWPFVLDPGTVPPWSKAATDLFFSHNFAFSSVILTSNYLIQL